MPEEILLDTKAGSGVLVTGVAGFIGFHVANRLLHEGIRVIGIDNLNDYYDVSLKEARLAQLAPNSKFTFIKLDVADRAAVEDLYAKQDFGPVVHLAAQAGVRYSITNPHAYVASNLVGFVNLIESSRQKKTPHFVYASSSSIYGANKDAPFSENDNVDHPISLYAATKKSNELIAHSYAHLYNIPTTGLRFFTVYGPWGRPDMAMHKFVGAIIAGEPIDVYNGGDLRRDFTYIDDIAEAVFRTIGKVPEPLDDPMKWSKARYKVFNIGNNHPVELLRLIEILEQAIGKKAILNMMPMQQGDVFETYANIDSLSGVIGYRPTTSIETGAGRFVAWYRDYYGV
jgi:UDP-glucuronate 4-epimerase